MLWENFTGMEEYTNIHLPNSIRVNIGICLHEFHPHKLINKHPLMNNDTYINYSQVSHFQQHACFCSDIDDCNTKSSASKKANETKTELLTLRMM